MSENVMSLGGEWQFRLDDYSGVVRVPGVWELQGFPHGPTGPAHYRRTFEVPQGWAGARIGLRFDAVSYYLDVAVNGRHVGTHEGMWTAFEFDVTDAVRAGSENEIELRITKPGKGDVRFHFRDVLVGFIPYVATTFGGPWQEVALIARRGPYWEAPQISADWRSGKVRVSANLKDHDGETGLLARATVTDAAGLAIASEAAAYVDGFSCSLIVPKPKSWGPESPALYFLTLTVEREGRVLNELTRAFGFRELRAEGDQLRFNGRPIHMRGVLSWGWNPETLAPTLDEADIRAEFKRVRALGFNLVKLCLFVPPELLFDIADEEGMFLWLELPLWYQRMNDHLRRQALIEYTAILSTVQRHPSLILYSLGCELGSEMADASLLDSLNTVARTKTGGALICDNSGSGEAYSGLSFDFADFNDYHFYCDLHYFRPLMDHFSREWRAPRPWIFGEFCDSDDFRDVDEITQKAGGKRPAWRDLLGIDGALDRWAYSRQETRMEALQLPFSAHDLVTMSRRQSLFVRKTILEQVRARRAVGGYVVTGLRDTPISTSGVFDDLLRPKYDAAEFRAFNADAVLVLEQGRSRVWRHGGDRPAPRDRFNHSGGATAEFRVVLANAGKPMAAGELRWQLADHEGQIVSSGHVLVDTALRAGAPYEIASIQCRFPEVQKARRYVLAVELAAGHVVRNQWSMWVFPPVGQWTNALSLYDPGGDLSDLDDLADAAQRVSDIAETAGAVLTSAFTPDLWERVRSGGRAILVQRGGGGFPAVGCPFWRESLKLLYPHPVLQEFPHDGYADLQFYNLAGEYALDTAAFLERIGAAECEIVPVIRRLDMRAFTTLDYLVEIRAGSGSLLATSLNFGGGAGDQVSVFSENHAARCLLQQMIGYVTR